MRVGDFLCRPRRASVEGEGGEIPFAEIAEMPENAHERGIVHRDLKPANIKVTEEGRVKVLNLGMAKAFEEFNSSTSPPWRLELTSSLCSTRQRSSSITGNPDERF